MDPALDAHDEDYVKGPISMIIDGNVKNAAFPSDVADSLHQISGLAREAMITNSGPDIVWQEDPISL